VFQCSGVGPAAEETQRQSRSFACRVRSRRRADRPCAPAVARLDQLFPRRMAEPPLAGNTSLSCSNGCGLRPPIRVRACGADPVGLDLGYTKFKVPDSVLSRIGNDLNSTWRTREVRHDRYSASRDLTLDASRGGRKTRTRRSARLLALAAFMKARCARGAKIGDDVADRARLV